MESNIDNRCGVPWLGIPIFAKVETNRCLSFS
jgi:hypothetical protein